ncbi:MAG: hypothetical protein J6A28_04835 [Clostridia bacterium]|nr:hypothetical protein [Clostridia bacterium]
MENKAKDKKKSPLLTIVFIVLGILAIGGIAGAFMLNYNTFEPAVPSILDDGENIFITTSVNENYQGYRFRFLSLTDEVVIDSKDNVISQSELEENKIAIGQTYKISACYLGETEGGSSPYSGSVTWTYTSYLQAPTLTRNSEECTVSWQAIENADYYILYYKENGALKSKETTELSFSYKTFDGGKQEFFVTACSNNRNYKQSTYSNVLSFNHVYKMKDLYSASLDGYILTVTSVEELQYLSIYVNGQQKVAKLGSPSRSNGRYTYTINIITIYISSDRLGVAPYPGDEYSVFAGEIMYIR